MTLNNFNPSAFEKRINIEQTEDTLYDIYAALAKASPALSKLANDFGSVEQKEAYECGVYRSCVMLGMLLGEEAVRRGKARHEAMDNRIAKIVSTIIEAEKNAKN
jgi:hypothetical protein